MGKRVRPTDRTAVPKRKYSKNKVNRQDSYRPAHSPNDHVLQLQRRLGNQTVKELFISGKIQAKLKIGKPGDIHSYIDSIKGSGKTLPEPTRTLMEQRFGQDFSQVRLHTNKQAVESARALNAKAFTIGPDIYFGAGQYSPQTEEGRRLIAHELTHVAQQRRSGSKRFSRMPDEVEEAKALHFDLAKWFDKFEKAVAFTLSRFYIGRDEVWVKQVLDIKDVDDTKHPAHYNPDERTIYFSVSGFRFIYNDRVLAKKEWTDEKFSDIVIKTAAHEAFHAYQDTPRFRSKEFAKFEKDVGDKLLSEFGKLIRSEVINRYEEFKTFIPYFTKKYLPESEIRKFMGENLPGFYRDTNWQLTAREEIMNQWLKILEDRYLRARTIESILRKGITGKGLKVEKKHEVSLIEKQAEKFAEMKKTEVKIWLLTRELEGEKDPLKRGELEKRIKDLSKETDIKNIPALEKRIENLKAEFMRLDPNKKEELSRIEIVAKELMELEDRLDALIGLRSGIGAVFKEKGLLISK